MSDDPGQARPLFALGEVRNTREIDYEIEVHLTNNAPQSLLRDLHRPVTQWGVTQYDFERHEIPNDAGRGAVADVKTLIYQSYRVPICDLMRIPEMWRESWAEFRKIMEDPWENTPKRGVKHITQWLGRW